ncbi:hypothetical protein BGZ47_009364 [Haplosporangium gracile]|nr:hypothetical protein BGZ47_009364 [Haplosporangium gracile]
MSARRFADVQALATVGANVSRKFMGLEIQNLKSYAATSSLLKKSSSVTTTTTASPEAATEANSTTTATITTTTTQGSKVAARTYLPPATSWIDQLFTSPTPIKAANGQRLLVSNSEEPSLLDPEFLATPAAHGYTRRPTITTILPPPPSPPSSSVSSTPLSPSGSGYTPASSSEAGRLTGETVKGGKKEIPVNKDALETLLRESKWLDSMAAEDMTGLNWGTADLEREWVKRERLGPGMVVYESLNGVREDGEVLEEEVLEEETGRFGFESEGGKSVGMGVRAGESAIGDASSVASGSKVSYTAPVAPTMTTTTTTTRMEVPEKRVVESVLKAATALGAPEVDPLPQFTEEEIQAEQVKQNLTAAAMPTSRVSRLLHYGGLAASLGVGAFTETVRRSVGRGAVNAESPVFLTPANMDRLVSKLTRMRGAALKLGQMLSIQDNKMLPPELEEVLLRVQNSANFMPEKQMRKVMSQTMGSNWESEFSEFGMTPIAAASIGQVHKAIHRATGMPVAVKVQYPGVAASIDSDLANIKTLVLMSSLLPRGMYLDNTIKVAQRELGWETDYLREADCIEEFGKLLKDDPEFAVPRLVREASGPMVLTMEWMQGETMMKAMQTREQAVRDRIGTAIMSLCLRELFDFQYMQTDPNWTNFLYNPLSTKLELLDFGATRGFDQKFTSLYLKTILAGAAGDREGCLKYSRELGFLTGDETAMMETAHIESLLTLSEPFQESAPDLYDFKYQTITQRVKDQIPTMLRYRLTPPPDETYSMHRKMAGAFLLCSRLGARVECKKMFREITGRYREEAVDERRGADQGRGIF